ncbi:hypothetical protein Fmac_025380 [Flemingia macrophylla]|uniref:non-specific serine/threonine protein kinase n=1 Tax=Flemingia macrophylla TaxID=520843 RepID=A0ABD1LS16_9FABA
MNPEISSQETDSTEAPEVSQEDEITILHVRRQSTHCWTVEAIEISLLLSLWPKPNPPSVSTPAPSPTSLSLATSLGAFRDPSDAFSRWPYSGFSWADHHITWSISGSYTTVNLLSGSAVEDGNPTVVTSLGRRIFDVSIQGVRYLKDFNITKTAGGVGKGITEEFDVDDGTLEIHLYWAGKGTTAIPDRGVYGPLISTIEMIPNFENPSKGMSYGAIVRIVAASCGLVILILVALSLQEKT